MSKEHVITKRIRDQAKASQVKPGLGLKAEDKESYENSILDKATEAIMGLLSLSGEQFFKDLNKYFMQQTDTPKNHQEFFNDLENLRNIANITWKQQRDSIAIQDFISLNYQEPVIKEMMELLISGDEIIPYTNNRTVAGFVNHLIVTIDEIKLIVESDSYNSQLKARLKKKDNIPKIVHDIKQRVIWKVVYDEILDNLRW